MPSGLIYFPGIEYFCAINRNFRSLSFLLKLSTRNTDRFMRIPVGSKTLLFSLLTGINFLSKMPYEIDSTPDYTTDLFKSFHRAPDFRSKHRLIAEAPPPGGFVLSFKVARSDARDQDWVDLPKALALSMGRVWGRVISLREGSDSANTETRARDNVLLWIPFWGSKQGAYRSAFARTNAFSQTSIRGAPTL